MSSVRGIPGFTLIELVITVAIVALLASIALPLSEVAVQRTKEQELRRSLREIRTAIDAYKQAWDEGRMPRTQGESGYPKSLESLSEGIVDIRNPKGARMYFLRRVPRDPFAVDPAVAAPATWGKRSYASSPNEPEEGEDVFDVYSRSGRKGLNGIPHRDW